MRYISIYAIALALLFVGCESSSKQEAAKTETETSSQTPSQPTAPSAVEKEVEQAFEAQSVAMTGQMIYTQKCNSCHGAQAERKALGVSQVISTWNEDEIINALKGYKAGTYGGARKMIMAPHAKSLSEEDMRNVAQYITNL